MAFEIAASIAFRQGAEQAGLVLLEPIMRVEARTPEEYLGNVVNDLSARRGAISGMEQQGPGFYAVRATVPLREMLGYITALRSFTSGRGTFSMEVERYASAPPDVADRVVQERAASRPAGRNREARLR
jgi:elongation factor G